MDTAYLMKNLCLQLGGREILRVPHFSIGKGSLFALVGPNGSGKTMFLSILAGLRSATGGAFTYQGRKTSDPETLRAMMHETTLVHQNPYLFRGTVESNVGFGLKVRGVARRERSARVSESLRLLGLEGFEKRNALLLSGGEVQRVAIARALALSPKTILFDEPTANVDIQSVSFVEKVMVSLAAEGDRCVFFTSHNVEQAHRLADTVYSLHDGIMTGDHRRNFYSGRTLVKNGESHFDTGHISFTTGGGEGNRVAIKPEDITIHREPTGADEGNCFPGRVVSLSEENGGVIVNVDAGERFMVYAKRQKVRELGVYPGDNVFLFVKPEEVKLV